MTATQPTNVRPSPLAGRWYPANPRELRMMLDDYLDAAAPVAPPGPIVGLLAPHAGLVYSGPVAAYAYKLIAGPAPDLVAVISPSHHGYPAPLLTTGHDAYATPLGTVPVDGEAVRALGEIVDLYPVVRDPEHSLEIELPFLQHVLEGAFRLLPVMVLDQSAAGMRQLGLALAQVLQGRNALLVASSDLSHFYPQRIADALDAYLLEQVSAFDPEGVLEAEEKQQGYACGRGAIAAVMWAAQALGANRAQVLHHATSGAVNGDTHSVVGYGAGVFYRAEPEQA